MLQETKVVWFRITVLENLAYFPHLASLCDPRHRLMPRWRSVDCIGTLYTATIVDRWFGVSGSIISTSSILALIITFLLLRSHFNPYNPDIMPIISIRSWIETESHNELDAFLVHFEPVKVRVQVESSLMWMAAGA